MSFTLLALIVLVGLLGPLLAGRESWHLPGVVGELLGGLLVGASGFRLLDSTEPTFTLLANVGFALVMFVVGSHVPLREATIRRAFGRGALGAALVGMVAALAGIGLAALFGTGHAALYGVVIASSSAALVLPIVGSLKLGDTTQLVAQVAIADAVCIVALPLAIDPARALTTGIGAIAVVGAAAILFFVLRSLDRNGLRKRVHRLSERRKFALELRINLLLLFGLAALAQFAQVSVLLAGFLLGLVVAAIGEPQRLARQLFGITEGFFGPLFFVWLGASISLSDLGRHPGMILLGVCLGAAAILSHLAARVISQPVLLGVMAAGQLGVPIAAAALGTQLRLLQPGEDAALLLGALLTIAATTVAASIRARRQHSAVAD
ncbi:cation:proton antiporter [Glaciihabitans sp. INWT7]|uniref:cation:proton antiporter n=1 Tax=Glaciihabitans sp. INWT7 TaxID=2596912 RepID=UPI001627B400|nr:cation:proton antiporter [Glaciihabitans sp. INWT7]QNE46771.1 cation:proton antiporter [Glaciihabitans sp. INWT7]